MVNVDCESRFTSVTFQGKITWILMPCLLPELTSSCVPKVGR
jgi:hypothetical protein